MKKVLVSLLLIFSFSFSHSMQSPSTAVLGRVTGCWTWLAGMPRKLHGKGSSSLGQAANIGATVLNPKGVGKQKVYQAVESTTGLGATVAGVVDYVEDRVYGHMFHKWDNVRLKEIELLLARLSSADRADVLPKLESAEHDWGFEGVRYIPGSKKIPAAIHRFMGRRVGMSFNKEDADGHWSENLIIPGTAAGLIYLAEKIGENRGEKKQKEEDGRQREMENRATQQLILNQQCQLLKNASVESK